MAALQQELPSPAAAAPGCATGLPPLITELERAGTSFLQPAAFFVSWQGVLTLAYTGFTRPLVDLKQRITAAHPSLPPENPGSKWPKTSLGCLRDSKRLTPQQLDTLCRICREESATFTQPQQQRQRRQQQQGMDSNAGDGIKLAVDSASVVLFECRSLERLLSCQTVAFQGGLDVGEPPAEERARVAGILAEPDADGYWFAASRDGNRESHYRGAHLGATLMHPLQLRSSGAAEQAAGAASIPGLAIRGSREAEDRRALLAAIEQFRRRVDAELPGMYAWFSDASLHITLRALIN